MSSGDGQGGAGDLRLARALEADRRLGAGELVALLLEARRQRAPLARHLVDTGSLPEAEVQARQAAVGGAPEPLEAEGHAVGFLLGRGGMGQVWLALHVATGALRALKRLDPGADAELRLRFVREAQAMARVGDHPALARIHAAGVDARGPWLVMDLLPGGDLARRLEAGPLPPVEVVALGRAIARGLAHVHRHGVLHRDLKPSNILFDAEGAPRLADFGAARMHDSQALTLTGALLGTPAYMAPEQALGAGDVDERADVWGLGAVLYHALTGRPPFEGSTPVAIVTRILDGGPPDPPSRHAQGCPAPLDAALLRALAREPADRIASASDLAAALDEVDVAAPAPRPRSGLGLGFVALGLAALAALVARLSPPLEVRPVEAAPVASAAPPGEAPVPGTSPRPTGQDSRRAREEAWLARVAREEAAEVLDELAAAPPSELSWRAAAAALVLLEDDPARSSAWRARATTLEDPTAACAVAAATGAPPADLGRGAGDDFVVSLLAVAEGCDLVRNGDVEATALNELPRALPGLPERVDRAPLWARPALAILLQRAMAGAIDGVFNAAATGEKRKEYAAVVRRVAGLAPSSRQQGPLRILALAVESGSSAFGRAEVWSDLDELERSCGRAGGARAALATVVVRAQRLRGAPADTEQRPEGRARLLEGWERLRADGLAAGILDEAGRPVARQPDGSLVVRNRSASFVARACDGAVQRASDAAAFDAWARRLEPRAAAALDEATRLAGLHALHDPEPLGQWGVARALLLRDDPAAATASLARAVPTAPPRDRTLHFALLAECALAAGDHPAAAQAMREVRAGVFRPKLDLTPSELLQLQRLARVVAAAFELEGQDLEAFEALRSQEGSSVLLPWRTAAETERHLRLLADTATPREAFRRLLRER